MLRTLPPTPRRWLLALLHSRVAAVLSFAPLTFLLFVISPWALYFTGWYDASLRSDLVHELMHLHLVLVGSLFFWPLVGVDPVPGRVERVVPDDVDEGRRPPLLDGGARVRGGRCRRCTP